VFVPWKSFQANSLIVSKARSLALEQETVRYLIQVSVAYPTASQPDLLGKIFQGLKGRINLFDASGKAVQCFTDTLKTGPWVKLHVLLFCAILLSLIKTGFLIKLVGT
jgi:hypothetical protein